MKKGFLTKKNLFTVLVISSSLVGCKKESTTPTNTTSGTNLTDSTVNNSAIIDGIDCSGTQVNTLLTKDLAVTNLNVEIKYTGGNGKLYFAQTISSTNVIGLKANLTTGVLANGNGTLNYIISGTPLSVGQATFLVSIGGKSCSFNITVQDKVKQGVGVPGSDLKDIDGNTYKTVILGSQQWMAENLKVTKFNDGTEIPNNTDPLQWYDLTTPSWCYYNDNASLNADYGKLYNLYVIQMDLNGNKNVCPVGWHVPSVSDWEKLTEYLGGRVGIGVKLKEKGTDHWMYIDNSITNSALFYARAGGDRANRSPSFLGLKETARWWSTTEDADSPGGYKTYYLSSYNNNSDFISVPKDMGISVRCIKN
jgi:uncharacterized protein (TIGR02145 family)